MTTVTRRFTAVPSDPRFNEALLDQLNVYAAHGFYHQVPLNDSLYGGMSGGYSSDVSVAAERFAPGIPCPSTGRWSVSEIVIVKSTDLAQAQVGPYLKIEPSLRVGSTTRTLGTFSQRVNKIRAGTQFPVLTTGPVLLPTDGALEVKVSAYGFPTDSLNDIVLYFRILNVGG